MIAAITTRLNRNVFNDSDGRHENARNDTGAFVVTGDEIFAAVSHPIRARLRATIVQPDDDPVMFDPIQKNDRVTRSAFAAEHHKIPGNGIERIISHRSSNSRLPAPPVARPDTSSRRTIRAGNASPRMRLCL